MDTLALWTAAFGPKHAALRPGAWRMRSRVWRGRLHVVATALAPRYWYRFHAVDGGRRGLRLARVVATGAERTEGRAGSWWAPVPLAGWSQFGLDSAPPEWHPEHPDNLSPMLGWGRARMPAEDVWASLVYARPQSIQSTFGPTLNVAGRRVLRGAERRAMEDTGDTSPPAGALVPQFLWQPTAKPRVRRWLNGLRRSRNARRREQRAAESRERREGRKVH